VRAVGGADGPRTLLVFYRPAPAVAGPLTVAFVLSVLLWLAVSCGAGVLLLRALRRADESRRRLLAGLAHDLGTPLTSIRGFAETHLSGGAADDRRGWTVVYREAVRLQGLVEDILTLSRIESGKLALVPRRFDLRDAVRSAAERAALAGGAPPEVTLPDGDATVNADRDRIDQVLANLVDNAYRHGEGKDVRIALSPVAVGWRLEVSDRGPGIQDPARAHLFEPFEGPDGGRRHGIGLAIVRELVTRHGGSLSLEDRPGGGTRAVVDLPYSPPNR
jgi:signal transduction histidine kinase